jgi:hypothetical protein
MLMLEVARTGEEFLAVLNFRAQADSGTSPTPQRQNPARPDRLQRRESYVALPQK